MVAMTEKKTQILVVYKKSQMELYEDHHPEGLALVRQREPTLWKQFEQAHQENLLALEKVRTAIHDRGIAATYAHRSEHPPAQHYDLVVSVGGDGTLLDVSHSVLAQPILGVNSSPDMSVGHFCAADADTFDLHLAQWLAGEFEESVLTRLQVMLNKAPVGPPVLNEVLVSHTVPAAVSRYILTVGDTEEEHKSSGIWISTAAGSTGAILSAGGHRLADNDTRLQYLVREPYRVTSATCHLLKGTVDTPLEILSKMRTGAVYLDGHRHQIPITLGDRLTICRHVHPLRLLGFSSD
jgi:NAD+ kinase